MTSSKAKRILTLLTVFVVVHFCFGLLVACDDCGKDGPFNYRFSNISSRLNVIKGAENSNGIPNTFILENYEDSTAIRYDSILLEVTHDITRVSHASPGFRGLIGNTVFACSPVVNFEQLHDVQIFSSADYSKDYPKGSNLSKIMSVHLEKKVAKNSIESILMKDIEFYIELFSFNSPPDQSGVHNLTIKYILADQSELTTEVKNLLIKK